MIDIKTIWKNQIELCNDIANDIIKHNASNDIINYTKQYAIIEVQEEWIRVNFGEAYCYIDLDRKRKPIGSTWWNNDEMNIPHSYTYNGSLNDLVEMSNEVLEKNNEYIQFYLADYQVPKYKEMQGKWEI